VCVCGWECVCGEGYGPNRWVWGRREGGCRHQHRELHVQYQAQAGDEVFTQRCAPPLGPPPPCPRRRSSVDLHIGVWGNAPDEWYNERCGRNPRHPAVAKE